MEAEASTAANGAPAGDTPPRWRELLSIRNIGAIYVWIAIIVFFSLIAAESFPTMQTAKSILNQFSVSGLVALSLVIPLAAGYFDLSIGFIVGLGGVLAAWLLENSGMGTGLVIVVTLSVCVFVGLFNALVVVGLKVDSFIGTLASGSILGAAILAISGDQPIPISGSFTNISTTQIADLQMPVIYMLVLMLILAWVLERTQIGRYFYAMGFNREAARLAGVRVKSLGVAAFVSSATIAGFAGITLAARVSSASPQAGTGYLIPAFSAAFLGATQFRNGRFNSWGTVVAVLLLGTGNVGILLSGGPTWAPQLFEGVVLIAAVALTGLTRTSFGRRRFWRSRRKEA